MEQNEQNVLDILLRSDLPDVRKTLPEKTVEIKRLSKLAGTPVMFTLKALTYDQVRRIQEYPQEEQAAYGVLYGCVSPQWKDQAFVDASKGIVTPLDAIKAKLTVGEIDELHTEIQLLSGYLTRTLQEVKNV